MTSLHKNAYPELWATRMARGLWLDETLGWSRIRALNRAFMLLFFLLFLYLYDSINRSFTLRHWPNEQKVMSSNPGTTELPPAGLLPTNTRALLRHHGKVTQPL